MHRGAAPPPSPWLPRQVKLFGWVSLLNDFASEMIYPLLPAFVTGVLGAGPQARSEEHTSELQSRSDLVCRLLLEKKKKRTRLDEQHLQFSTPSPPTTRIDSL